MDTKTASQFRDDELVTITRFDKKTNQYVNTIYPKVGGRLRLAHSENQALSISAEIITYDQSIAVVKATVTTEKGSFNGIGMASVERDQKLAAAILELAETRSIARALRFSGFGLEYTGYEEISHLPEAQGTQASQPTQNEPPTNEANKPPDNGNGNNGHKTRANNEEPPHPGNNGKKQTQGGNGNGGNGNGDTRITNKQLAYILTLGKNLGMDSKGLDAQSVEIFGVKVAHLKVNEASSFIQNLNGISF